MKLSRINLNLLVVLDILLEEKHITKASQLLNLTQSTVSSSLKQLRELFDDELLIREKNKMVLSTKAKLLYPKVKLVLQQIQQEILTDISFDPIQATNTFKIGISSYLECILLPDLKACLKKDAPNIKIITNHCSSNNNPQLSVENLPHLFLDYFPNSNDRICQKKLYDEQLVCASNGTNPLFKKKLTLKKYLQAEHLQHTEGTRDHMSVIDSQLEKMGCHRNITMTGSHLSTALYLLASSDYLITLPLTVVKKAQQLLNITYQPLPFEIPRVALYIAWHQKYNHDKAHTWFRSMVHKVLTHNLQN